MSSYSKAAKPFFPTFCKVVLAAALPLSETTFFKADFLTSATFIAAFLAAGFDELDLAMANLVVLRNNSWLNQIWKLVLIKFDQWIKQSYIVEHRYESYLMHKNTNIMFGPMGNISDTYKWLATIEGTLNSQYVHHINGNHQL